MGCKFRIIVTLIKVILQIYFALAQKDTINNYNQDYYESADHDNYEDNYIENQPSLLKGKAGFAQEGNAKQDVDKEDCWINLHAADHIRNMDELDKHYEEARQNYQLNVGPRMDREMLDELLGSRGAAHRAVHRAGGDASQIPAGLNLGGFCMMRMKDSMLFFNRMKLRNSTHFQVNYLHNDLVNMALITKIGLNDLHLVGAYERTPTDKDPSVLFYRPNRGIIELLMKNVLYKMDARLRMMSDRLTIEVITSELVFQEDILLTYLNTNITNEPEYTIKLDTRSIDDFLQRLKTDLDLWMKDYFNDYLMYYQLPDYDNTKIQEHDRKKTILVNEYLNFAVNTIRQKIYTLGGSALKMPSFTFFSVANLMIRIKDGVLRGLESMYRRSVGTGSKHKDIRTVDVIVGFSKLRATYKFEAVLPNGAPPLAGVLVLTADELTGHLGISLVKEPESVDINFDFIQQMKAESLSVEGPTNRLLANYKHLLENQILAIMSNALLHNVKMLNTITRCVPFIYGQMDEDNKMIMITGDTESNNSSIKSAEKSPNMRQARKVQRKNSKKARNMKKMFLQFKNKYL